MRDMVTHYAYRMDHDTGFAPNPDDGLCTLCGCKTTKVEKWANVGSWIVGIGGNNTGVPNKLIFAMKISETPLLHQFREANPARSAYLQGQPDNARVLVSRQFWYLGDHAVDLAVSLTHITPRYQEVIAVNENDIATLVAFLKAGFKPGKNGKPNNPEPKTGEKHKCANHGFQFTFCPRRAKRN